LVIVSRAVQVFDEMMHSVASAKSVPRSVSVSSVMRFFE